MAYIGKGIENLSSRTVLDSITASATATYNLLLNSVAFVPSSAESLTVSLNGVIQKPQSSYTVSGSTIVFDSALTSSDVIDFILAERAITLTTVGSGSVGTSQLVDGSVSNAKLANSSITLNGSAVSLGGSATIGGGKIGQVVTDSDNANSVISSTTYADTGLTASITPSATSSKILIMVSQDFQLEASATTGDIAGGIKLLRDTTTLYTGSDDGDSFGIRMAPNSVGTGHILNFNWHFSMEDSPSSTSSITYKTQARTQNTNSRFRLNNQVNGTSISTITLMEVLA